MNLRDRGITVGDLVLILIFVISSFFIINKVKESGKEVNLQLTPKEILVAKKS